MASETAVWTEQAAASLSSAASALESAAHALETAASTLQSQIAAVTSPLDAEQAVERLGGDDPEDLGEASSSTTREAALVLNPGTERTSGCRAPVTIEVVREWLAARGLGLVGHRAPAGSDAPLDRVAMMIGERLEMLGPLLRSVRRVATSGQACSIHLRDESARTGGAVTALATELHDLGLLSYCRYERAAQLLHVRVAGSAAGFLSGGWLERWAAARAEEALAAAGRQGLVLRGVELQMADGQMAELDVLVVTEPQARVWIECRTGAYQDRLDRDVRLRRALGIDPREALVVLAEVTPTACVEMSAIHGLTVITPDQILDAVTAALPPAAPRLAQPRAAGDHSSGDTPSPDDVRTVTEGTLGAAASRMPGSAAAGDRQRILSMLRHAGLGPHPELRGAILGALVEVLSSDQPRGARELRIAVAETVGTSRARVGEVLRALSLGGALLGATGEPLAGLGEPIARLVSDDVPALDAFCQRAWRANLAAQDPTLLGSAAGDRAFRDAVGDCRRVAG